jgi:hypothetical protein
MLIIKSDMQTQYFCQVVTQPVFEHILCFGIIGCLSYTEISLVKFFIQKCEYAQIA